MVPLIEIKSLEKQMDGFHLGPISLDLNPGTVFALVGPNGAGKTTSLNCISGVTRKDAGSILFNGKEISAEEGSWKANVAFVNPEQKYFEKWSVAKNLAFIETFFPGWQKNVSDKLLLQFKLSPEKKVKTLSRGDRVKLAAIVALARPSTLIILDEPTANLDPVIRAELISVLFDYLRTGNRSILISSHIMSDVESIADEVGFLKDGKLCLRTTKDSLLDSWGKITFSASAEKLSSHLEFKNSKKHGNYWLTISSNRDSAVEKLKQIGASDIQISPMTMEEIAVHILKGEDYV